MASMNYWLYVGTYSARGSKGIGLVRFDAGAGAFGPVAVAAELPNPTFQALHPNGRVLYSVSEVRDATGRHGGSVHAFTIDRNTGALGRLNGQSSEGAGPCHVSVDRTGRCVMAANYSSGGVVAFPVDRDGRLRAASSAIQHSGSGPDPKRQQGPHAHSITPSPDNRFALAADLGLDRVMIYRLDPAAGRLTPGAPPWAAVPPGHGPRHVAFHPTLPMLYVVNEMGNTVTAFSIGGPDCALREEQTLTTLAAGFEGENTGADIHVHPSGRFLYSSNRGEDSIAVFGIGGDGRLAPLGRQATLGRCPRNFAIDPSGAWLLAAHQESDSIVLFRIDAATGALSPVGRACELSMPVCVTLVPAP
jgi:6-phosphogluconolactonase